MNEYSVLITGANGFIGSHLTRYLVNSHWNITALVRSLDKTQSDLPKIKYHTFSIDDEIPESVFKDVRYVVHCAYKFQTHFSEEEVNVRATTRLISICRKRGIKFILLSSFSAHPLATSQYGKIKTACENLCDPSKDVVLKSGLVLGNGGLFGKMVGSIRKSMFFPIVDGGRQPLQTIFIDDLCTVIEFCLNHDITGQFYVAETQPITYKIFISELAFLLRKRIFFIPVPYFAILGIVWIASQLRIPFPVNSDNVLGLKNLRNFDTKKDMDTFGLQPKNYKESLQILLKSADANNIGN
jgi:nucleoside-diphosphate-sugar epimerase